MSATDQSRTNVLKLLSGTSIFLLLLLLLLLQMVNSAPPMVRPWLKSQYEDQIPSISQLKHLIAVRWNSVEEHLDSSKSQLKEPQTATELRDVLRPVQEPDENATDCDVCTRLVSALKGLLERFSFEEIQGAVTVVCYGIMDPQMNETRKEELCNGSVALQGPHVAAAILSTSPKRFCQFQNLCFDEKYPTIKSAAAAASAARRLAIASKTEEQPVAPRNASAMIKLVQLTDIHIDIRYSQGSLADCDLPICCLESYGQGSAGHFGDYNCNIPPKTIELFLRKVAAEVRPDFVVYTGDISGSRLWDESQEEILGCSSSLIQLISNLLPNVSVYPAFGNHEMFPTNLYYKGSDDIKNLTDQLTDWWTPIARFQQSQIETMKKAGYYAIDVRTGLKLICYNSNYMYTKDWYNVINFDNRTEVHEMMHFVEDELQSAKVTGSKVILIGHHPPNSKDFLVEFGHWYHQLVLTYADVIVLQMAGHKHKDHFHLIPDSVDGGGGGGGGGGSAAAAAARSLLYLSTAITAGGTKNPALRVYYVDPESMSVVDYDQYYFDLTKVTGDSDPEIVKLYSAKEEYSLNDLSADSWSDFVDRLERDDALLLKHLNHGSVEAQRQTDCDDNCKRSHVCSLRTITYDAYLTCVNDYDFVTASTSSLGTFIPSSFLPLISLVHLLYVVLRG